MEKTSSPNYVEVIVLVVSDNREATSEIALAVSGKLRELNPCPCYSGVIWNKQDDKARMVLHFEKTGENGT